jgi:hypothetical protein
MQSIHIKCKKNKTIFETLIVSSIFEKKVCYH